MVSTRRKPASKTKGINSEIAEKGPQGPTVGKHIGGIDVTATTASLDSIKVITSNDIHQVSCNSSTTGSSNSASDASTVETTTTKSQQPLVAMAANLNAVEKGNFTSSSTVSAASIHTTMKSIPKKKSAKPLKPSLKHPSTYSSNRRHNTPPLPPGSVSLSPMKRGAIGSTAHTRSNAGAAELLKGVDTNVFGKVTNDQNRSFGGSSMKQSKNFNNNNNNNLLIGKNAAKQQQKDNNGKDGIITIRNGLSVRKIVMNTGTLYIYMNTHHAEFVRTK